MRLDAFLSLGQLSLRIEGGQIEAKALLNLDTLTSKGMADRAAQSPQQVAADCWARRRMV